MLIIAGVKANSARGSNIIDWCRRSGQCLSSRYGDCVFDYSVFFIMGWPCRTEAIGVQAYLN
jgi:hypothetical protein